MGKKAGWNKTATDVSEVMYYIDFMKKVLGMIENSTVKGDYDTVSDDYIIKLEEGLIDLRRTVKSWAEYRRIYE